MASDSSQVPVSSLFAKLLFALSNIQSYLETLDISQLTISAILVTSGGNWALVRDSKGDGHVIRVGTPIGKKGGKVTEILEKKVVVREHYKDIRGRKIVTDRIMRLPSLE